MHIAVLLGARGSGRRVLLRLPHCVPVLADADEVTGPTKLTGQCVKGPNRQPLSLANLPTPDTKRWVIRRKAEVVAAVRGGLLSVEEAYSRHALDSGEFSSWGNCIDRFGLVGPRTTRILSYLRAANGRAIAAPRQG